MIGARASGLTHVFEPKEAVAACAQLTRAHSSTFYLGSRFFPARERSAVSVIYAVCRSGDDAVDEAPSPEVGRRRLLVWQEGIERAYAGEPQPGAFLEVGLHWVLQHYEVPRSAFDELYLGLESDLDNRPFHTMDELMLYCRRVAGVVGLLIAPIAGYRGGEATLQCALALGQAMQLTNILRDVGEDLAMGRLYLPLELMDKHGVTRASLEAGVVSDRYIALLEELAERTCALYREGWQGIPKLNGVAAAAVGVAALNYEGILNKLRQNGYDNLTKRAYLRPVERLALIPKAVYGICSAP
ncbi:phytoene/squalene synthase family protein [Truepera radiovictrix]|uniref:Phytoene synthase n=1 Tax=Truepera radiovictrix (strain DSM 17093 / CIP 108686 / LMG 22925 / RQ-24) TaxID=649638 RepID=D7CSD8_TRURR|nr:phytoene/squalene synthase family protein [Truepera radiovictrix]ADI15358.1 Phytoene synthase [Truepera radiovictrix DSM 17093]WMT56091.1 phytoene/squalene synthase family protein [Truepera radiovictrix]